nr:endo-1,4-beta-xylanase [uncultured bacterium]
MEAKQTGKFVALATLAAVSIVGAASAETVPEAYRRQWNGKINADIDARIEKYRKADRQVFGFTPGTRVKVEQISHSFQFGSHIFNLNQLGNDEWNRLYEATFTNLWNAATLPFYWKGMEPEEGRIRYAGGFRDSKEFWDSVAGMSPKDKYDNFIEYRRVAPDVALEFCERHGISPHGHVMIYPPFGPVWVTNGVDKAGLAARYELRIRQLGDHYGDRLPQWDVVNESVDRSCTLAGPFHDKVCWGRPGQLVPEDYTYRCHKWAAEAFPDNVSLVINDSWREIYVPFVKQLIERGAKVDVVGIQMHIFTPEAARKIGEGQPCIANGTSWAPEDQIAMLEKLDTLGRPIHLSEITIPAVNDSLEEQEKQARMVRDNYRLWFSWPSIYRITFWNIVDYTYHKESLSSGLFTKDMKKKAAYHTLDRLINHEWRTRLEASADDQGRIAFRGFRGKYRLSWTDATGATQMQTVDVK